MEAAPTEDTRSDRDQPRSPWFGLGGLMLAVLGWGGLLAVGSYLAGRGRSGLRAVTILGTTAAFVLLWAGVVWWRQRQIASRGQAGQPPSEGAFQEHPRGEAAVSERPPDHA
jgi:threonine/homoserine/homoserine lactone efflux protein